MPMPILIGACCAWAGASPAPSARATATARKCASHSRLEKYMATPPVALVLGAARIPRRPDLHHEVAVAPYPRARSSHLSDGRLAVDGRNLNHAPLAAA